MSAGSTTIQAAYGGRSDTTTLTVFGAALTSITVTPATSTVPRGIVVNYRATGTYANGVVQDITSQVSWSSSAPAVASVSGAAGSEGSATTLSAGTTAITARLGTASGTAALNVTIPNLVSVTITPANATVPVGFWRAYTATALFNDGSTWNVTDIATWTTSAPSVAVASNAAGTQGHVTGVASGTTSVSAAFGGLSGSASATVNTVTLTSISISPANAVSAMGVPLQLSALGTFSDGTTLDVTEQVGWKMAPKKNGTISNSDGSRGVVTMTVTRGSANVLAQRDTLTASAKVSTP